MTKIRSQWCPVARAGHVSTQCTCFVICIIFWTSTIGDADLSISTSTPTPCYGDVVTLVCHHPELASNPDKYITAIPQWRENGEKITLFIPSVFTAETAVDLIRTTLTINITVDHFKNKSFNYSCLLVLAGENELQTGGVETSEEVTVDPVDMPPAPVVVQKPNATSEIIKWQLNPKCFTILVHHILWYPVDSCYQPVSSATTRKAEFTLTNLHSNTTYMVEIVVETVDKTHTIFHNVSTTFIFVTPAYNNIQTNLSGPLIPVTLPGPATLSPNQFVDTSCQGEYAAIGCLAVTMVTSWLFFTLTIAVLCRKLSHTMQGDVKDSTTPPGEGPCVVMEDNPAYVTIELRNKTAC